jgi:hypothetical protein
MCLGVTFVYFIQETEHSGLFTMILLSFMSPSIATKMDGSTRVGHLGAWGHPAKALDGDCESMP